MLLSSKLEVQFQNTPHRSHVYVPDSQTDAVSGIIQTSDLFVTYTAGYYSPFLDKITRESGGRHETTVRDLILLSILSWMPATIQNKPSSSLS